MNRKEQKKKLLRTENNFKEENKIANELNGQSHFHKTRLFSFFFSFRKTKNIIISLNRS